MNETLEMRLEGLALPAKLGTVIKKRPSAENQIAAIRASLDHCNAQPPCFIVDAIYDFKQAVEEILGEK